MTFDKTVLKNRSAQFFGLILLIILYLIFEQILPAYDRIPYFRSRIETSRQDIFNLELNHDHLIFYQAKRKESQARIDYYQKHVNLLKNTGYLQDRLNSLCQTNKLEIINQQFDLDESNPDLVQIAISLSLKGKYRQLSSLLDQLVTFDPFITITGIEMTNQSLLAQNPFIVMNISFTAYLPKIL